MLQRARILPWPDPNPPEQDEIKAAMRFRGNSLAPRTPSSGVRWFRNSTMRNAASNEPEDPTHAGDLGGGGCREMPGDSEEPGRGAQEEKARRELIDQ